MILRERHYLGPARSGHVWEDEHGVIVFGSCASRMLPKSWVELSRWCITGGKNAGSMQWAKVRADLPRWMPDVTTVVSYSDPSQGHTGALYRACNWLWAPTWHRLCPPPTGNGKWSDKPQAVKDRWIYPLKEDEVRESVLSLDKSIAIRFPGAEYREPRWKKGRPILSTGGGDYGRWAANIHPLREAL
jgi:hypothetical protein